MLSHAPAFIILKQVDSTNNYAMAAIHEGLAKHGDAVFTGIQTHGKGQRGKAWQSGDDENIALSVTLKPSHLKILQPFQLSVAVALAAYDFYSTYDSDNVFIKWPNDIYWRDRKAGGILIENVIRGNKWQWAVAGIGININQTEFDDALKNAVSLKQVTGKSFDTMVLAKQLYACVIKRTEELFTKSFDVLLEEYNQHLFRKNMLVKLKKDNVVFETLIKSVSPQGFLITQDAIERQFDFGEVEWVL